MPVEVAREQPLEGAVLEREVESVALDIGGVRRLIGGDGEHLVALVEAGYLSPEVAGDEACPARDVEGPLRRGGGDRRERLVSLGLPGGIRAGLVQAALEPPVVVLAGARV